MHLDNNPKPLAIINARIGNEDAPESTIVIEDGKVSGIAPSGEISIPPRASIIDACRCVAIPGLVDVHVHLRQPGYEYKETIASGTLAAAVGGFTTVCAMPNVNPCPDNPEDIIRILEIAARDATVEVLPYAAITKGRKGRQLLDDYQEMARYAIAFSDDGSGVADYEVMRRAMSEIAKTGKVLAAHCEAVSLLSGGYIHDGEYARNNGHRGISSESEWREVEENIRLAEETGCRLHICHISTAESVELVRKAKARGIDVTCETAAHYLTFSDADLREEGRFKMNPPLRNESDREAIIEGCIDGTIDIIASDHAPHSAEEKDRGLEKSAMGVTGLEISFAASYTALVVPGLISFERLVQMMAVNPRKIFGIEGGIKPGDRADITIADLDGGFVVNPNNFLSKGKSTPFAGMSLEAPVTATVAAGHPVYSRLL